MRLFRRVSAGTSTFSRRTPGCTWPVGSQKAWTMRVVTVDLNTGKRELFKEIEPPDRSGILSLGPIQITPDGKTYVYGFTRRLSDLYVVEDLR